MQQFVTAINSFLKELDLPSSPRRLYEPMRYILDLGGKRLRPTFCLLAYSSSREDWEKILPAACSLEVFHNFTLMHDDIMDEAPLRRGKPTIHTQWDENVAILSGDAMLIEAYKLLSNSEPQYLPAALEIFNRNATLVCEGQQLDMEFETRDVVSIEEYLGMIRLKTAVLLAASLQLGALLAGESDSKIQKFYDLGIEIGLGFQLMDDYLDVFGDQENFGKQVGGDILSNKKTFLLIKALELAKGKTAESLNNWLTKETFDPEEKVRAVKEIYRQLSIDRITQEMISEYYHRAESLVNDLELAGESRNSLIKFMQKLRTRIT